MQSVKRLVQVAALVTLAALFPSCGGSSHSSSSSSSSTSSGGNSQAISVNLGPDGNYANGVFTNVTVCAPGSSNCQTINNVLLDTGSFGLRVLASALTVSLPQENDASGKAVVECAQFASGITWGPVKTADVKMAGEAAGSVAIQVIGDPAFASVPAGCAHHGSPMDNLSSLGANGLLGVGTFIQDCGPACITAGPGNPGFYYGCASSSSCQIEGEPASSQVQNPVALFASDNNGILVQLPAESGSAPTASGSLVFGVGTQSNNSLGSANVLTVDNFGNITTVFNGKSFPAFIDSGSNAYFILNTATTGIPVCPAPAKGFYCPSSPASLSATNRGSNGASNSVNFTIGNADTLFMTSDAVFPTLGGPNGGSFDWGLPFFYGRNVFVGLEGRSTPGGSGPFWAY